ncbi:MAG: ABC transporter permease [Bryobacteraceae bacterium]
MDNNKGSARSWTGLLRDLNYGWRGMRKAPIFTAFAVLTLGLGIGANTTVFTIVNTLLLHPLPAANPSRLAALYDTGSKSAKPAAARLPLAYANFADYAEHQASFSGIAAFTPPNVMTLRTGARPERVFGEFVTQRYFETLGITPAIGRFFAPAEDSQPGSAPVVVLSYNAWRARFGGFTAAIGRTLELNNVAFTVVGVAPPGFLGVSAVFGPDVWLPATMCERAFPAEFRNALSDRGKPLFHAVARLAPGATLQRAQADLETIAASLERGFPATNEGHGIAVRPISDELYTNGGGTGGFVFGTAVLLAIVALILAIACANIANLLLARAAARRREIAVRLAIGAGRGRLIRQLLTESVLLSLLGFLAGIGVGYAGCRFVWSFVPPEVAGNMTTPRLDGAVMLASLAVSLATAFLFGLAPAWRASKTDVISGLKEGGATGESRRTVSFANLLLAGQVAFSLVCLVTATLFFRSIQRAYTIDPGFPSNRLALLMMDPAQAGYSDARVKEFYRAARERVANLPGVAAASWASGLPFWNTPSRSVSIEGQEQRRKSNRIPSVVIAVGPDYLNAVGIPLAEGRSFSDSDDDASLPVAMINEALAHERWPGGAALGHRFQLAGEVTPRQVVGIVKNANYTTLGEAPQPCVYLPMNQNFLGGMVLYVRSQGDPATVLPAVQRQIREVDPNIRIGDVRTGAKLIEQVLFGPRVGVALLGVFGSLALVLASVGLYGVMAYSVTRRRKEIGLRMALGASRAAILRVILRDGMALVGYGIAAGLAACLLLGRALSKILFGLSAADPVEPGRRQPGAGVGGVLGLLPARALGNPDRLSGGPARPMTGKGDRP